MRVPARPPAFTPRHPPSPGVDLIDLNEALVDGRALLVDHSTGYAYEQKPGRMSGEHICSRAHRPCVPAFPPARLPAPPACWPVWVGVLPSSPPAPTFCPPLPPSAAAPPPTGSEYPRIVGRVEQPRSAHRGYGDDLGSRLLPPVFTVDNDVFTYLSFEARQGGNRLREVRGHRGVWVLPRGGLMGRAPPQNPQDATGQRTQDTELEARQAGRMLRGGGQGAHAAHC